MRTHHYSRVGLLILLSGCRANYGEDSGTGPTDTSGASTSGVSPGTATSGVSPNTATSEQCPADPCVNKACGESCAICYFCSNGTCATDAAVHICSVSGECVLDLGAVAECPRDFDPCAGKQCGEVCDVCPEGADCPFSQGLCNGLGVCELANQPTCAAPSSSGNDETLDVPNADAGDIATGEQGSTGELQSTGEQQYFEPGCDEGSPTIEPGYYTPCEVEGEACPSGGWCRQVSINPCVCTGEVCCDACGRMQALCLTPDAGTPVEAGNE